MFESRLHGDIQEHSDRRHRNNEGRSPERNEGKRQALSREKAAGNTHIDRRLKKDPARDTRGKQLSKEVRRSFGHLPSSQTPKNKYKHDGHRAYKSQFFANHRENKIRMRVQQIKQ